MRRPVLGRLTIALIALTVALLAASLLLLPPRQQQVGGRWSPLARTASARGVYHVHTNRSDGTGSVEDVARAAARARLDFVVITDHGDGTRAIDPPRYLGNVLVVDAVEVSTRLGHLSVLGLTSPAPYRLAGWPDEVVEDVRRLGGVAFAAHPDSARSSLSWRDWDVPLQGLEWLNADSEWRDEPAWTLARTALTYGWRPVETIVALFDRPDTTLARWDRFSRDGRYLVALAGADAHARLGVRDDEGEDELAGSRWAVKAPGYEAMFRAFSTIVELDQPLGEGAGPVADAARLVEALAAGRSYTVIDGLAAPGRLEFVATHAGGRVRMGGAVPAGSDVTFSARVRAPAGAEIRLLRNGERIAHSTGLELTETTRPVLGPDERGAAYRVEVGWPSAGGRAGPWILSNPIFVAPAGEPRDGTAGGAAAGPAVEDLAGIDLRSCRVEKDPISSGTVTADESGDALTLAFGLAEAPTSWVALACGMPQPWGHDQAVSFEAEATRPLRLGVQVRDGRAGDRRWGRSVALDGTATAVRLWGRELRPVGKDPAARPTGEPLPLLLVLDRTHGVAGMRGELRLRRMRLGAPADQVRTVSSR